MRTFNTIVALLTVAGTSNAAPSKDITGVELSAELDSTVESGGILHRRGAADVEIPELAGVKLLENGVYDIGPEGIELSDETYKKLTGRSPPPFEKRQDNPCNGKTHRSWDLSEANWNKALGNTKVMSSPICGPASISNTFTQTYSFTVGGSLSAGAGIGLAELGRTIGISVDFSYTTGNAIATGYSATCDERHPCIATFRPWIGHVKGKARYRDLSDGSNKLCGSGIAGNIWLDLPITRDCNDTRCGADGVWDHCYYVGNAAKGMCPNLGGTPKTQCAKELYPGA